AWLWVEVNGYDFRECPELEAFLSQGAETKTPDAAKVGTVGRLLLVKVDDSRAKACWRLSRRDVAELFAHLRCAMTALLHLEVLHKATPDERDLPKQGDYQFQTAICIALNETDFEHLLAEFEFQPSRDAFMLDIVGNTVCADLLDYAKRDSHFAGLRLDYD